MPEVVWLVVRFYCYLSWDDFMMLVVALVLGIEFFAGVTTVSVFVLF